jgi:hypothetical protein
MRYPVQLEGISAPKIEVETPSAFQGAKVLINGQPAPKGKKRGEYLLRRDDGRESTIQLKSFFLDPVPQVVWAGNTIRLAEALTWYQWAWSAVPIILVFLGGAIGGAVGSIGVTLNVQILRSEMSGVLRYGGTALISIGAFVTYAVCALLFRSLLGQ